jgi:hypothetical protein
MLKHMPQRQASDTTKLRASAEHIPAAENQLANTSAALRQNWTHAAPMTHPTTRVSRRAELIQLQHTHGNAFVARKLAQRDQPTPDQTAAGTPGELTEMTVPVPEPQRSAAATADPPAATPAPAPASQPAAPVSPPPVPAQAQIRAPVSFKFHLLPPELQLRLFDELRFTATVSDARLAWHHQQLQLNAGYNYGGAITAGGQYRLPNTGTLSAGASYNPDSQVAGVNAGYQQNQLRLGASADTQGNLGADLNYRIPNAGALSAGARYNLGSQAGSLSAGYQQDGWRVGANATTQGSVSATLGYGRTSPTNLNQSIYAGEQSGRNLLGAAPAVLDNPLSAPDAIAAHKGDVTNVQGAVQNLRDVADLRQNSSRIDWGVYLKFSHNPNSSGSQPAGTSVTANAEVRF